jgi:hypothetical protein
MSSESPKKLIFFQKSMHSDTYSSIRILKNARDDFAFSRIIPTVY